MDCELLERFAREIENNRPVWDFGCGPGNTSHFLNDLGVETSGLDLSEGILEQARAMNPGIHFRKGTMLDLEFGNDSIAGITAFYAIVHFTQEQVNRAFREIFRVLRPGGLFLFTFHIGGKTIHLTEFLDHEVDIDFMFFSTGFIRGALETCGFEKLEIIEREPYPEIEYQSRRAYVFARKPRETYQTVLRHSKQRTLR